MRHFGNEEGTVSKKEKVYVIDSGLKAKRRIGRSALKSSDESPIGEDALGAVERSSQAESSERLDRLEEKGSSALAFLAFLAGPFAVLATLRGRSSKSWIWIAALSTALASALIVLREVGIFPRAGRGFGVGSLVWLLAMCVATLMGFTAWARGVALAGRIKAPLLRRLPEIVKHPASVGFFGFLVPGLGLHAMGAPKRAACALWMVSLIVISILVLWQAPALWQWNAARTGLAFRSNTLEHVFLVMGALGLFGAFSWIVQALDGMRLAGQRPGREPRPQGDLAALALLASVIAFIAAFQPAELAGTLNRFGIAAREDGMRIVPLYASTAAMRLDPSRPEYALAAIESNESLGRTDRAEKLRDDLAERWNTYERSVRLQHSSMVP